MPNLNLLKDVLTFSSYFDRVKVQNLYKKVLIGANSFLNRKNVGFYAIHTKKVAKNIYEQ
jgi:hypothetical protein